MTEGPAGPDRTELFKKRGLDPVKEHRVPTPGGKKGHRDVDVVGVEPRTGKVVEMHQVGKQNKNGSPVKRERDAMDDVEGAEGMRPEFHPYDK